jgi:peptidase M48-like protein
MPHSGTRRLARYLCSLTTLGLACVFLFAHDASAARRKNSKRVVARHASNALAKAAAAMSTAARVQPLVDAMREELTIEHEVTVEVVPDNPLKASVAPVKGSDHGAFVLSIDKAFLRQLNQADLRAVIAHELGHVWIYTHHPFLQTEQGANEIALLAVPRQSIEKVYGKVWLNAADAGSLKRLPAVATTIIAPQPK